MCIAGCIARPARSSAYKGSQAGGMTDDADLALMTDRLTGQLRPNAKSLIVSLFGDAILPHGGSIWLGSLAAIAALFGCNERVVRTSVFRLSKEGWLTATQAGRRSWYGPTQSGRRRFEAADRIIYAVGSRPWSENWTIVFTGLIEGEARETVRADLAWQGFGQLLPGVMLHPAPDEASVREALAEAGLASRAVAMKASGNGWMSGEALRDTAARAWDLGQGSRRPTRNFPTISNPSSRPWHPSARTRFKRSACASCLSMPGAGRSCATRCYPRNCCRPPGRVRKPSCSAAISIANSTPWPKRISPRLWKARTDRSQSQAPNISNGLAGLATTPRRRPAVQGRPGLTALIPDGRRPRTLASPIRSRTVITQNPSAPRRAGRFAAYACEPRCNAKLTLPSTPPAVLRRPRESISILR